MSRRRSLEEHRHSLGEIREIMNSMKTLAYMETRKLSLFLPAQEAVVAEQRDTAAELLTFHPELSPTAEDGPQPAALYLLLGSERGLCRDFNQALIHYMDENVDQGSGTEVKLLCIGNKLAGLMVDDPRIAAVIEGPSVVEEVPLRLAALVEEVQRLRQGLGASPVYALVNHEGQVEQHRILPTFLLPPHEVRQRFRSAPRLNQPAPEVFAALLDQHLPVLLQWLLYAALMEENHLRVTHLDSAVRHLDEQQADLGRRSNILRQEEIIEEIEVILLSAASIAENRATMGSE